MRVLILVGLVAAVTACGPIPSPKPLPRGVTYGGLWDSNWGQMRLIQVGTKQVHGQFSGFRNGSVTGDINGNVFVFKWTQLENRQYGRGFLKLSSDGKRMEGRWGYQTDYTDGGRWWATRVEGEGGDSASE